MPTTVLAAVACAGASASPACGQAVQFVDATVAAGVSAAYSADPGVFYLAMAAGGAAGDFNRDGWQDLFVLSGWGAPDRLYINNQDGTFTERAALWGVARMARGLAVAVGDFNNDGWQDIFVTVQSGLTGSNTNVLYRNNGNGTFTDVAAAAGLALSPGMSAGGGWGAAWGDYDLDGRLDLAVSDWTRSPGGNRLYHNNGDSTFTNVTSSALNLTWLDVQGFSPRFADMNGDRYPELLWVSDFGQSRYFVNNGNGTFANATPTAGVGLDGNGMGTSVADFNGDGRPDWFVTSIYSPNPTPFQPGTGNMLYLNLGLHHFVETGQASGVRQGGWGWGSVADDLDNDGRVDLAHTNGWDDPEFANDQTCVFRNLGGAVFAQVAPACGVTHTGQGRGMIALDYNNDGKRDLVIFTNDGNTVLYRNDLGGPGTNYLRVFLNTHASSGIAPDGYGAHLVATVGGVQKHQWINGGCNYQSQSELSAHFGLGTAAIVSQLRVEWPDGSVTLRANIPANQTIRISSCPGDWNADGATIVSDIFSFLQAWFAGAGDFDASGTSTVQDIFQFLAGWFAGCA